MVAVEGHSLALSTWTKIYDHHHNHHKSRGSSVSVVSGYRLDYRANEVRSPAEAKGFFL
jgi:hypothetical protein